MSRFQSALVAAAIALSPAIARADWEYTRWGMSPEEVVQASRGDVKLQEPGDRSWPLVLAKGKYRKRGAWSEVRFEFTPDNKLQEVIVSVSEPSFCSTMMDETTLWYGPYELSAPVSSGIGMRSWYNGPRLEKVEEPDRITMVSYLKKGFSTYVECEFRYLPHWNVRARMSKQASAN